VQIKRLLDHDGGAEKLVPAEPPDIGWLVYDRDGDGKPDDGYGTLEYTDVIEIWRTTIPRPEADDGQQGGKQDQRPDVQLAAAAEPGATGCRAWPTPDAHICFHDSGMIRNWVRSATGRPDEGEGVGRRPDSRRAD
jgi:hypothetical protein